MDSLKYAPGKLPPQYPKPRLNKVDYLEAQANKMAEKSTQVKTSTQPTNTQAIVNQRTPHIRRTEQQRQAIISTGVLNRSRFDIGDSTDDGNIAIDIKRVLPAGASSLDPGLEELQTEPPHKDIARNVWFEETPSSNPPSRHIKLTIKEYPIDQFDTIGSGTNPGKYETSSSGTKYPYRGHGPVWDSNSCYVDCCIVAARLLNVGRTIEDIGPMNQNSWRETLEPFHKSCLAAFYTDWGSLDRSTSIRARDNFRAQAVHAFKSVGAGDAFCDSFGSAMYYWRLCTEMATQSWFETRRFNICKECDERTEVPNSGIIMISFPLKPILDNRGIIRDYNNSSMQEVLKSNFGIPSRFEDHQKCQGKDCRYTRTVVSRRLPTRLVVEPSPHYKDVKDAASSSISFEYQTATGHNFRAKYRWQGGIYWSDGHYRVYWRDQDGSRPDEDIMVYDGYGIFSTSPHMHK
jgi:hypothetical protein